MRVTMIFLSEFCARLSGSKTAGNYLRFLGQARRLSYVLT